MEYHVGVIGLGYVGLPLAVESGKHYPTIGFDINKERIAELEMAIDRTLEVEPEELKSSSHLSYSSNPEDLKRCNFYIITVPTPIDQYKNPDLTPLRKASEMVGQLLNKGDMVVYESTVFPGCTEEECVPILEKQSGLKFNQEFHCGYSPERINPGDKEHRVTSILKVTSGSTEETAEKVDQYYKSFISAGTHKASSIKVAEAAKVIENAQRDINIAFVNELSLIFERLEIDTLEVLKAAGTKWNFLPFKPGLVGGHCIGVDPFYLTQKAESVGYHPQVILAGRKINDNMGQFVANKVIKLLGQKSQLTQDARILIMGFTFKENCPDTRNTRVIDIYNELRQYGLTAYVHDPQADSDQVEKEYGLKLTTNFSNDYDVIILAVSHSEFLDMNWEEIRSKTSVIYDVKGILPKELIDGRL